MRSARLWKNRPEQGIVIGSAMKEAEYAVDRRDWIHRVAGLAVWTGWIVRSGMEGGVGSAAQTAAGFLLPLFCIVFPSAMGAYRGIVLGEGRHIDSPSHPVFLRWAGWFVLLAVPMFLWFLNTG
jgi:hypothetical protein